VTAAIPSLPSQGNGAPPALVLLERLHVPRVLCQVCTADAMSVYAPPHVLLQLALQWRGHLHGCTRTRGRPPLRGASCGHHPSAPPHHPSAPCMRGSAGMQTVYATPLCVSLSLSLTQGSVMRPPPQRTTPPPQRTLHARVSGHADCVRSSAVCVSLSAEATELTRGGTYAGGLRCRRW
jgi:hypothetical protein